MRITVTVVVIMFELTGALTYILPTMVSPMETTAIT
jgi:chloride channel 3/4/5